MDLADLIKQYRKEHKISQRKFAEMCKISCGYVSMLETRCNPSTGEPVVPSVTVLKNISQAIGVEIDSLLDSLSDDMVVSLKPENATIIPQFDRALIESYYNAPDEIRRAVDGLLAPYRSLESQQAI